MLEFLDRAKRALWTFVEVGFLTVLSLMLIYMILGKGSGEFVTSVADNVLSFANAMPTQSLIGIAVVLALLLVVIQRMR
jgi:hypothetical protein